MTVLTEMSAASSGAYQGYFLWFSRELFPSDYLNQSLSKNVVSSNAQVLDGNYSCKFTASYPSSEAILSTTNFDISSSYNYNVLVFFSIYMRDMPTTGYITVTADFGGGATQVVDVDLENTAKWLVQKSAVFAVPSGATHVTIQLVLSGIYRTTTEVVAYVDNFGIYLQSAPVSPVEQYTIFSDNDGVLTAHDLVNGTEKWTFDTAYDFLTAKPAVVDGIAYFGDGDSVCNIYALHGNDGTKKWLTGLPGSIDATPEVLDDEVYIATSSGKLFVINKGTGAQIADYNILGLSPGQFSKIYSNQLAGNTILMTSQEGVFGFNLQSKQITFRQPLDYAVDTVPLIHNGVAYYGDLQGYVYAVDFNKDQSLWRKKMGGPIHASPKMVGEQVVFGCDDGQLYAYAMEDGELKAKITKPGFFVRSFSAASNRLYVAFNAVQGMVCAYEVKDHDTGAMFTELWCFNVGLGVERDPLVLGNQLCFASNDKNCYCVNADTGKKIWSDVTPIAGYTEPALVPLTPPQSASRRYDQYCYLMSHNSFADFLNGWWLGNQELSITQQLDYGVRGLMLDTHKIKIDGMDKIVLYHGIKWSSLSWYYLETAMVEIRIWLKNNPTEVVTIQFENRQRDPRLTAQTLQAAGVTDLIFDPSKTNTGSQGSWGPVLDNGWPTIDWMVQNNKRLVLFAEKDYDGIPYVWNYTVETWYGGRSMTGSYAERGESEEIPLSKNRSLYTVNYFPDVWYIIPYNGYLSYNSINSYDALMARTDVCKFNPRFSQNPDLGWKHHLPNFLAIDFISRGANGGALRAVKEINLHWKNKS